MRRAHMCVKDAGKLCIGGCDIPTLAPISGLVECETKNGTFLTKQNSCSVALVKLKLRKLQRHQS